MNHAVCDHPFGLLVMPRVGDGNSSSSLLGVSVESQGWAVTGGGTKDPNAIWSSALMASTGVSSFLSAPAPLLGGDEGLGSSSVSTDMWATAASVLGSVALDFGSDDGGLGESTSRVLAHVVGEDESHSTPTSSHLSGTSDPPPLLTGASSLASFGSLGFGSTFGSSGL